MIGKLSYTTLCLKLNPLLKQASDLKASRQIFMRTGGLPSLLLSYPFSNYFSSPHLPPQINVKRHLFLHFPVPVGSSCLNNSLQTWKCWTLGTRPFSNLENPKTQLTNFLKFAWIPQVLHGINQNSMRTTCAVVSPSFFEVRWSQVMRTIRSL